MSQVGVLYHDFIGPGETFTRNTGAAHFTISAKASDKDNTSVFSEAVIPVAKVVGTAALAAATAGASVGLLSCFGIAGNSIGAVALVKGGLVSGASIMGEAAFVAATGALITTEMVIPILLGGPKEHYSFSSPGWYFGGENYLEIVGGPKVDLSTGKPIYRGSKLTIRDVNNHSRSN